MKISFAVNDIATEQSNYTTVRLARRAAEMGHEVSLIGLVDFTYEPDGKIAGLGQRLQTNQYASDEALLAELQHPEAKKERVNVSELDVLLLRWDPADEVGARAWAPTSALLFAQLAQESGVIVLNDPTHLTDASNKTYFQRFPEAYDRRWSLQHLCRGWLRDGGAGCGRSSLGRTR